MPGVGTSSITNSRVVMLNVPVSSYRLDLGLWSGTVYPLLGKFDDDPTNESRRSQVCLGSSLQALTNSLKVFSQTKRLYNWTSLEPFSALFLGVVDG